jgi:NADH dehydrogenase FAD-containing subunit
MKQLVLLGSGPSHLQVLKELAQAPLPAAQVTLVAPSPREVFAGMLPGWVAGRYLLDDCAVPIAPLAQAARATWVASAVDRLDVAHRLVHLANGQALPYDALSLDAEPAMNREAIAGAGEHALCVRPVESFLLLWEAMRGLAEQRTLSVVVIGRGVAAVELALAVQDRLAARARVVLVTGGGALMAAHAAALRSRVKRRLKRSKIALFEDGCIAVTAQQVQLEQGLRLGCDVPLMALDGTSPAWLADSGLALDAQGLVSRLPTLQSSSHAEVFVAGACLGLNLRRFLAGGELVADRDRPLAWTLVASGAQSAIAGWGLFAVEGRWVAGWKERRDREEMARYRV